MKRRSFLAALGLAPFFKWAHRQVKPKPKGWFIAEFKHYPAPLTGGWAKDVIIYRREKEVDKS